MVKVRTRFNEERYVEGYQNQNFDNTLWKHRNLCFLDFTGSSFVGAIFINCQCHKTNFEGCDFTGTEFRDTDFSSAILKNIKGLDAGKVQLVSDKAKTPGQIMWNSEHWKTIEAQNNVRENNRYSNFGRPEKPSYKIFKDAL